MTKYADAMTDIVARIHPALKESGFRKRRNAFNRSDEEGVVQVISFQMGAKLPPGASAIPGLRPDLHGQFTVNFGVAIEEAWMASMGSKDGFSGFVNDYDCEVRLRLGDILGETTDLWWSLDLPPTAVDSICASITDSGLGWLADRGTRSGILSIYEREGLGALPMPTPIPIVMLLIHLGQEPRAVELFNSYYNSITDHPSHRHYLRELAESQAIELLPGEDPTSQ